MRGMCKVVVFIFGAIIMLGCGSKDIDLLIDERCNDLDTRCFGAKIQFCQEGKWGESVDCPQGEECHSQSGQCKQKSKCEEGFKSCVGKQIRVCGNDGQWGVPEDCKGDGFGCVVEGNSAVCKSDLGEECVAGTKGCVGD